MTESALQIDFNPQPKGIAVVCSTSISEITGSGNYSALQDLLDGYATEFQRVHVFAPGKPESLKSRMDHRINWIHGKGFGSALTALSLSGVANRKLLKEVEIIRTFGPSAGLAGRLYGRIAHAPVVSSLDDLAGNRWRESNKLRSKFLSGENRFGPFSADYISAKNAWETELISGMPGNRQVLIEPVGVQTDIYAPAKLIDPARSPIVLWAVPLTTDENLDTLFTTAERGSQLISGVNFVAIGDDRQVDIVQKIASERDLPITALKSEEVEPLVDLIERSWACVSAADNGFPSGLSMLAFSAGIPVVSINEIDESYGFKNHLHYVEITDESPDGVAFGLNMLRNWSSFALRVARSGQSLVESRYSTLAVARSEAMRLAEIARGTIIVSDAGIAVEAEIEPQVIDTDTEEVESDPTEDSGSNGGFDLVAAALSELHGESSSDSCSTGTDPVEDEESIATVGIEAPTDHVELDQDAISALFAEPESGSGPTATEPTNDVELDQDAISALFAGDSETGSSKSTDDSAESGSAVMDQDAISALFASTDAPLGEDKDSNDEPAPVEQDAGIMDQDTISALFASDEPTAEDVGATDEDSAGENSDVMGQDAISALFASGDLSADEAEESANDGLETEADESPGVLGQDAISSLFESEDFSVETGDPTQVQPGEMDQDAISALFAEQNAEEDQQPDDISEDSTLESTVGSEPFDQDAISALFDDDGVLDKPVESEILVEPFEAELGLGSVDPESLEDEEDVHVVQVSIENEDDEEEPEFMLESFDDIEVDDELDVDALIEAAKHDEELV